MSNRVAAGSIDTPSAAAALPEESDYIFGIHDEGGERHMETRRGWIVISVAVGRNVNAIPAKDYTSLSSAGYGVIVRLNHDYEPNGTLPYEVHYPDFVACAKEFVRKSRGAHIWIVANETNLPREWPAYLGEPEEITPERYVRCFNMVRDAIKSLGGRHQVILQGVSPGDVIARELQYYRDILDRLDKSRVDGIALHTYTSGSDPSLPHGPQFRNYRQFLWATPEWARFKPVYITETAQGGPWEATNTHWIREAYMEIDAWNRIPANQPIRTLALYHWSKAYDPEFTIDERDGAIADFEDAATRDFRWNTVNFPHGRFFIQSGFGGKGNYECVVGANPGNGLLHFWRNNDAVDPVRSWQAVTSFGGNLGRVTSASLIQSNYDGNLEVVALVSGKLVHFYRDAAGWHETPERFGASLSGNAALIQGRHEGRGNFEVVVPRQGGGMSHFWRDNDRPAHPWHRSTDFGEPGVRVDAVALIQSNYGNLEVVARIGPRLAHYFRFNGVWSGPKYFGPKDAQGVDNASGAPGFMQARYTFPGNFVVVTPVVGGGMTRLARDNNDLASPWLVRESFGAGRVIGAVSVLQSNLGRLGTQEVVGRESGSFKVLHWYLDGDVAPPTWRGPFETSV